MASTRRFVPAALSTPDTVVVPMGDRGAKGRLWTEGPSPDFAENAALLRTAHSISPDTNPTPETKLSMEWLSKPCKPTDVFATPPARKARRRLDTALSHAHIEDRTSASKANVTPKPANHTSNTTPPSAPAAPRPRERCAFRKRCPYGLKCAFLHSPDDMGFFAKNGGRGNVLFKMTTCQNWKPHDPATCGFYHPGDDDVWYEQTLPPSCARTDTFAAAHPYVFYTGRRSPLLGSQAVKPTCVPGARGYKHGRMPAFAGQGLARPPFASGAAFVGSVPYDGAPAHKVRMNPPLRSPGTPAMATTYMLQSTARSAADACLNWRTAAHV